jgi:hypothetical protein
MVNGLIASCSIVCGFGFKKRNAIFGEEKKRATRMISSLCPSQEKDLSLSLLVWCLIVHLAELFFLCVCPTLTFPVAQSRTIQSEEQQQNNNNNKQRPKKREK